MRNVLLAASLLFAISCTSMTTPATDAASSPSPTPVALRPHGTTVEFASSPGNASGYLALPQDGGKHPAIIVIQEWWGLNDWVRQQTEHFANQGYVSLAVDLYRGKSTDNPEIAHELMRGLPEDRALADLEAAFNYLASRPDVDPARIGVIGWCMGGGYSLALAASEPRLRAAVVNYGRLISDPAKVAAIRPAILGNFGAEDRGIPAADVRTFAETLKNAGKDVDVKVYEGAGHAFMNENNREGYVASAAADAWRRIDSFFARTLGH